MKKVVFIALLFPVALLVYRKIKAAMALTYEVVGVDLRKLDWSGFNMIIKTNIINKYPQKLFLNNVSGVIKFNGSDVGTINQSWNTTIFPGNNMIDINIRFDLTETLQAIQKLRKGKNEVNFNGTLKFERITLPIKHSYLVNWI